MDLEGGAAFSVSTPWALEPRLSHLPVTRAPLPLGLKNTGFTFQYENPVWLYLHVRECRSGLMETVFVDALLLLY